MCKKVIEIHIHIDIKCGINTALESCWPFAKWRKRPIHSNRDSCKFGK